MSDIKEQQIKDAAVRYSDTVEADYTKRSGDSMHGTIASNAAYDAFRRGIEWREEQLAQTKEGFVSASCGGERCMCCGQEATHKIEETIFQDDPSPMRHPLTGYLCDKHFDMVLCPYNDKRNIEHIAKDEWEKLHPEGDPGYLNGIGWMYWLKAFKVAMTSNIPPRINLLTKMIQSVIDASVGKPGYQNDYEHGKHTAANMIMDELNDIFYGQYMPVQQPAGEAFSTGIRDTVGNKFQGWVKIDHQTFFLPEDEEKSHAEWYLNNVIIALNRLIKKKDNGNV